MTAPWANVTFCKDWPKEGFLTLPFVVDGQFIAGYGPDTAVVPFAVDEEVMAGGRRIVIHEFPTANIWKNEDLGVAKATIDVKAYVFGDHADEWARVLYTVLGTQAVGGNILMLPWPQGFYRARCSQARTTFRADAEGRIAFDITFVLEPRDNWPYPPSLAQVSQGLMSATRQLKQATIDDLQSTISASYAPSAYAAAATSIQQVATHLNKAYKQLPLNADDATVVASEVRYIKQQSVAIAQLFRGHKDGYSGHLRRAIETMTSGGHKVGAAYLTARSLKELGDFFDTTETQANTLSRQAAIMRRAVIDASRRFALADIGNNLSDSPSDKWESLQDIMSEYVNALAHERELALTSTDLLGAVNLTTSAWTRFYQIAQARIANQPVISFTGPLAVIIARYYNAAAHEHDEYLSKINANRHPLFASNPVLPL